MKALTCEVSKSHEQAVIMWVLTGRVPTAFEPQHEVSNNVVCVTSKGSDQPVHMRSLIRAFASPLNIL